MVTVIKMVDILQTIMLKTDLEHVGKDVRVIIPALYKSTKRPNVGVDWGYLTPVRDGKETVVKFAGVRYHIWDDYYDYSGNGKEDRTRYLAEYQLWFYEKKINTPNGCGQFKCSVRWKPLVKEEVA